MKVFYRTEQVAESSQPSPSALKPRLVVEDWRQHAEIQVDLFVTGFLKARIFGGVMQ